MVHLGEQPTQDSVLPSVSEVYLLERPAEIALRVRHDFNATGFSGGNIGRPKNAPCMFFGGPPSVRYNMKAIGRDGKSYPKAIRWSFEKKEFLGPASLSDQGLQIFEVDEYASKRFVATDSSSADIK